MSDILNAPATSRQSPLGRPVQIAYAVVDVVGAARRFSLITGAGPFVVVPHVALQWSRIHGVERPFDHSSAYGQWGDVMVELVEEHSPPIIPVRSSLHHLAFMVDDLAVARQWCIDAGWAEVLLATTRSGQQFAFHDARHELGHLIEMYEPAPRLLRFYGMIVESAKDWDGTDPVRSG
jgi:catechol 2,3-dioxygenase-like lactoylglutathione lyase family enzyme